MAIVAVVEGVKLYMYGNDHPPAHFHAMFAEYRAVISLETLMMTQGQLPRPKLRAVLKWAEPRRTALMTAWDLTQAHQPVGRVQ